MAAAVSARSSREPQAQVVGQAGGWADYTSDDQARFRWGKERRW